MSRMEDLISKFCPTGVESVPLGEVAKVEKGQQVNRETLSDDFPYPVYNGGIRHSGRHVEANYPANTITVSQGGASAGYVNFVPEPLWLGAHCYAILPSPRILNRFLYFYVKNKENRLQESKYGAGIPALDKATLTNLLVPVPPIEVQREIVSILDKFTQLEAELEAELEARKIQYEVMRDKLLDFSGDIERHPLAGLLAELCPTGVSLISLGAVADIQRGTSISRKGVTEGPIPVLAGGQQPSCWHNQSNRDGENVVISGSGAYSGFVSYWLGPIWVSDAFSISGHSEILLTKFCFYILKNRQKELHLMKRGSGVPHVYAKDVSKLTIPTPPIEVQKTIVSILDKFEALVSDITVGLPAEIAARRKQYEHYRNKLLTFKELDAE